jgi:hypothetical protein
VTEPALYNESSFYGCVLPILDREGAHSRLVIVKATYAIVPGEKPKLAEEQRPERLGDEPWGVPEIADIRLPADFCPAKPGTDFVVSGHAVPPQHYNGTFADVHIAVADREMKLRVHGERKWQRTLSSVVPGPSDPVAITPLAWSLAYGGIDLSEPSKPLEEPRNPVGRGVARDVDSLIGTPAPQIEYPNKPIHSAGVKNVPAGCAALGRNFEPRRGTAGTYGSDYVEKVYPARPNDYKEEHENCAAPDLVFRDSLRGGERVTLSGVHAGSALDFLLPKWRILIEADIDGVVVARRPHLDTVLVNTDAMELELVWRGLYRCPAKMRKRFESVTIRSKEFT